MSSVAKPRVTRKQAIEIMNRSGCVGSANLLPEGATQEHMWEVMSFLPVRWEAVQAVLGGAVKPKSAKKKTASKKKSASKKK